MKLRKFVSIAAAVVLALSMPTSSLAANAAVRSSQSSRQELTISDEEGLLRFSESCRLDSYSQNLYVTLSADISLSGEFTPIPVFGGTFDGNGHTISGLKITKEGSHFGLFRYVQHGALVKNLTVKGVVSPSGSSEYIGGIAGNNAGNIINCNFDGSVNGSSYVGGIAGINEASGLISGCGSTGAISGEHISGGIAGSSSGTIMNCTSRCSVNTTASEAKLSIRDIDWDSIISQEEPSSMTDAGGIAGFSDGIVQGCENFGTVGYPHIGYNVGGIVGRQYGYVSACVNNGEIFGRKDVGGIVGQMEPYRSIDFDKDTAQKLLDETAVLGELCEKLISDAKAAGGTVNDKVQGLTWQMEQLRQSADDISDRAEGIYNGWADGLNEVSARVDEALDGAVPALEGFRKGLDLLSSFSSSLEKVFDEITAANDDMQSAIDSAQAGIDRLNEAIDGISEGLDDISSASKKLSEALGDADRVNDAVKTIINELGKINGEVKNIITALDEIGEACDDLADWVNGQDFEDLSDGIIELSRSLQDVTSALSRMSAALEKIVGAVDGEELQEGLDELVASINDLSDAAIHAAAALEAASQTVPDTDKATEELRAASDSISSAAEHLSNAADSLEKAVNSEQLNEGLDELETASKELSEALEDAEEALAKVTDAYEKISSSDIPEDTYDEISKQLDVINNSLSKISSCSDEIISAMNVIADEIDTAAVQDSLELISDALDKISDSTDSITSAGDNFNKAADSISSAFDTLESASGAASDAFSYLSEACEVLAEACGQLADTAKILGDKPAVEFPAADEEFTAAVDGFSNNFSGVISAISVISSTANKQGDLLMDDFQEINDEFAKINDILQEMKDKLMSDDDSGFTTDVSEDGSSSRQGTVVSCVNYGGVQGDVNIGGITGSMAIDVDFDPEDDIAQSGETSFSYSYKVRDIIDGCTNTGEVTAKKNYCGGIVGRMEMGVVRNSVENGKVTATSGSYVGGIAGSSTAAIRDCIVKASVSAMSYVGGIAGQGLILTDNAAILKVSDCTERVGAIAGFVDFSDDNTEVLRNKFVDRGTAGIDGVSYAGAAYPIDFAEFARLAGSTAEINVKFIVEGKVTDTICVDYGAALSEEDFPKIPVKSGYFAKWSDFDNECVTFPTEVEAIYSPYITVIESTEKSGEFPLVLADGFFDDVSVVKVSTESSSVFPPDNNSELRLVEIICDLEDRVITQLRFLAPSGRGSLNVMQFMNGSWKNVEFTQNGHYLIVENPQLSDGTGYFCVQLRQTEFIPALIIGGCSLLIAVNIVLWAILLKKRRAAKMARKADAEDNQDEKSEEKSEEPLK